MRTILVTGGAGFVGSQTVLHLQDSGYRIVVIDDLTTGHQRFGEFADRLYVGQVEDPQLLDEVFRREPISGVIHCAARALVEESTREPVAYFQANVGSFSVLLDAVIRHQSPPVVFSSSATVYGAPETVPISESSVTAPVNPYGESKLAAERLLAACIESHGLRGLSLRYFNAAGADPGLRTGELHDIETHVIPNVISAGLDSRPFVVRGLDWPTADGSCVRDFIHTFDLARAHLAALEHLWRGGESGAVNLGSGTGVSVLELVRIVSDALGVTIHIEPASRRPGDAAALVADIRHARELLGFESTRSDIRTIVDDAITWTRALRRQR